MLYVALPHERIQRGAGPAPGSDPATPAPDAAAAVAPGSDRVNPAPEAAAAAAPIPPALLAALAERVRAASGLSVTPDTLARAVRQRLARRHVDAAAYCARITPAELQQLLELLVVPESWLFRDPGAFTVAVRAVQAKLAGGAASVRLLVLPCAGGEEAYSLAIALTDAGIAPPQWHMDAVDLSSAALARGRNGWFSTNAFRGAELAFRARHFTRDGAGWRIAPALQRGVHFHHGNLLTWPGVAGGYDVVFCRNLLIYFDEPTSAAALARLRALLAPDGVLCAGYAEVPAFCAAGFAPLPIPAAFALRHAHAPEPVWLGTLSDRRATPRGPDRRQPTRRTARARVLPSAAPGAASGSAHALPFGTEGPLAGRSRATASAVAGAAYGSAVMPPPGSTGAARPGAPGRRAGAADPASATHPSEPGPPPAFRARGTPLPAGPHAAAPAPASAAGASATQPPPASPFAPPASASADGAPDTAMPAASPSGPQARGPTPASAAAAPGNQASVSPPSAPRAAGADSSSTAAATEAHALLAAAQQQADLGDLPAAAVLCRRVIAAAPNTADAYYLLAMAAAQQGDPQAARAELRRCLYLDPNHYPCLCQLALLAEQDGDTAAAARLRRRAARVHAQENA